MKPWYERGSEVRGSGVSVSGTSPSWCRLRSQSSYEPTIPGLHQLPSPKLTFLDRLMLAAVFTGDQTPSINIHYIHIFTHQSKHGITARHNQFYFRGCGETDAVNKFDHFFRWILAISDMVEVFNVVLIIFRASFSFWKSLMKWNSSIKGWENESNSVLWCFRGSL